mmetsp:Transcript_43108/g.99288  ORF Transcript_43108/g.99288 Transcript_43108/m.99288 type:complete len:88 (-) Transcript_43108:39-302(-)
MELVLRLLRFERAAAAEPTTANIGKPPAMLDADVDADASTVSCAAPNALSLPSGRTGCTSLERASDVNAGPAANAVGLRPLISEDVE